MAAQIDKGVVDGRASRCDPDETNPTPKVINNHCIKQTIRKIKPIPPPLDLSKRGPLDLTSSESVSDFTSFSASPRSPASSNQKHLPFRKRLDIKVFFLSCYVPLVKSIRSIVFYLQSI